MIAKLLLFYLLSSITGSPILAILLLLGGVFLLDRGTVGLIPDVVPLIKRGSEKRRLRRDLQVNPHNADARFELGRLLLEQGRPDDALVQMELALPKLADVGEAQLVHGLTLLRTPRWREAQAPLERSLTLEPECRSGEAHLRLGEFWSLAQDHERAREAFQTYLSEHEFSVEGHVLAARERIGAGDVAAGREHARLALAAYKNAPRFRRRFDRAWAWRARALVR